ncbi:AGR170Cp [Eremothecium gossypii ATCC 10895]|uniref:Actin cytoskeleton-regulatory complex protein SLA1 n=1 Tax=Eremothecium gossypii (strain ATCC 10895 / CBS 109.51 / FGSC 9923 / NRRL Y-1056) TaxID=284811 RepID=Q74ZM8_EREGS|nr:AGR170Cp [Eremothecium gossypii ATCC 10895]AAS54660.2 AGR170Cp [Eremothecium gossypii ATCC 10895]AEY98990.1 FAGR170Cp [Eremothecium gossypii FDAG1]
MTIFLGVYKAVYAYEPQNEEELALEEDELLYLLQKSEVDDWWTVKKRVLGGDMDEPVGLVPNNYIEEAPVVGRVRAVYDYEEAQNPDEELVFREGDEFDVYDDRDADWVLVRKRADGSVGFAPGNYVEKVGAAPAGERAPARAPALAAAAAPVLTTAAAVRERPLQEQQPRRIASGSSERDDRPLPRLPVRTDYSEDEEAPPPKPARPEQHSAASAGSQPSWAREEAADSIMDISGSWDVQEIDGRRKKKAKLQVGRETVLFCPADGDIKSWPISHLISYDNEKKHIFLEFKDPYCNLELHVGTNSTAIEIKSLLAEMKATVNPGALREIEAASVAPKKRGIIKYNFFGESSDELTVKEGDVVYILNDKKSADWWMCEIIGTSRQGVIPAQFIDVQPTEARKSLTATIAGLKDGSSASSQKGSQLGDWKQDVDQDSSERRKSMSKKKEDKKSKKKKFPDPKNTRIWVDRSNTFKVEAEFLGFVDGKIHLHKVNGVKIAVAAEKLSMDDLAYVEKVTGTSLNKYRPEVKAPPVSKRNDEQDQRRQLRQHEDREREREERERDRRLRERELEELRKARDLLDEERAKLQSMKENSSQRPRSSGSEQDYDWFEFFLNCGVDVSNCQRYTLKFEKEHISKEILPDLCPPILRTLDMREGDIIRVMKYLDNHYGRTSQSSSSPPADSNNANVQTGHGLSEQLLPIQTSTKDDDAWTVKPAANTESSLPHSKKEFSGSFQDLLDLKPLEPKKKEETPQPNLKDLESVKTGGSAKAAAPVPQATAAPLDPFKTGGNNLLPTATGGVLLMPVLTGGLMPLQTTGGLIPLQRTGGFVMPQTTFGQPTGNILPVQKTANGLIPVGGGLVPQTTFGVAPLNASFTGGNIAFQRTGGMATGMVPQTSFAGPMNPVMTGGMVPLQRTGGFMPNMMPQTSFSTNPMNQISTGMMSSQLTGGMAMAGPQTSFGMPAMNQTFTGGVPGVMPQTSFGMAQMNPGSSSGMIPLQRTGGMPGVLPQNSFGNAPINQALTGGLSMGTLPMQTTFGAPQQMTGFQQNPMMGMQNTSGMTSFPNTSFGTANINQLSNNMQGMSLNQQQVPLQNQPTGFGFGNGPQQQKQANIYNASAANPFGF